MAPRRRRRRSGGRRGTERGQVLVWSVIMLPILLVAAGLSLDVASMVNVRDELTTATDAAALAAGRALVDASPTAQRVRDAAHNIAAQNVLSGFAAGSNTVDLDTNAANAANGAIVLGTYNFTSRTFIAATAPVDITAVNAVRITTRLSQVASPLPLVFGRFAGTTTFDTTRQAIAVLGGPSGGHPTVPLTIDQGVFTGKARGFTPPNSVSLSTKTNMDWTGYFGGTSASTLKHLVETPEDIPRVQRPDHISRSNGTQTSVCQAMDDKYNAGDIIVAPVSNFSTSEVVGFTAIQITDIKCTGNPKHIDGDVVWYHAGLDGDSVAECYGVDCRTYLTN